MLKGFELVMALPQILSFQGCPVSLVYFLGDPMSSEDSVCVCALQDDNMSFPGGHSGSYLSQVNIEPEKRPCTNGHPFKGAFVPFLSISPLPEGVQVPNNHILTQNLYEDYYYPNLQYPSIGCMDPLGYMCSINPSLNPKP